LQNEQVKHIVSLHQSKGRRESREYLIEGKRFVNEAFLRKAAIIKIFYCSSNDSSWQETNNASGPEATSPGVRKLVRQAVDLGIPVEEVSENVMKKMSATEEPQGILALLARRDYSWTDLEINSNTILLIVDGLQDPGNLGTVLRTALAADVRQIILTKGTVDLYNPKVLRSSMGAIFSQTIITESEPEEIVKFCSVQKIGLAVSAMEGKSIYDSQTSVNYPLALVIGNEAFGCSEYLAKNAEQKYSIPMFNNVESLNAAMAAGIFLYELRRQVQFL